MLPINPADPDDHEISPEVKRRRLDVGLDSSATSAYGIWNNDRAQLYAPSQSDTLKDSISAETVSERAGICQIEELHDSTDHILLPRLSSLRKAAGTASDVTATTSTDMAGSQSGEPSVDAHPWSKDKSEHVCFGSVCS